MFTVQFRFGDAGGSGGEQGVEFAVLSESELADDLLEPLELEANTVEAMLSESVIELELASETGEDRSVEDLSESIAPALDPGGGGLTSLDATTGSAGAGSGDGASFFGLEAQGRRFAYIVDISRSMLVTIDEFQTRWDLTRGELDKSLSALDSGAQFHVQLYNSDALSLFGTGEWVEASGVNKRLARDGLRIVNPTGGTDPLPAFEVVFDLDPEPDAIYFMTDGEFSPNVAAAIRRKNGRVRVPVNCILFGNAGNADAQQRVEALMRNIARQSGGRFIHVTRGTP